MKFGNARCEDKLKILALYRSVIGSEFCVWNEVYPGVEEIESDLRSNNLFVLTEGDTIVAAASIVPENEMDEFPQWKIKKYAGEVARVVVSPSHRGRRLAALTVNSVIWILNERGCKSVHISVASGNKPALATYEKLDFQIVGETNMYGNHYFLMEKAL